MTVKLLGGSCELYEVAFRLCFTCFWRLPKILGPGTRASGPAKSFDQ